MMDATKIATKLYSSFYAVLYFVRFTQFTSILKSFVAHTWDGVVKNVKCAVIVFVKQLESVVNGFGRQQNLFGKL